MSLRGCGSWEEKRCTECGRRKSGWSNLSKNDDGNVVVVGRADMFSLLMECDTQEEFKDKAQWWLDYNRERGIRFKVMNIALAYQAQKRESEFPWTFRDGDNNFDRYDDFTKKEDKN